jgi:hypothetical protein
VKLANDLIERNGVFVFHENSASLVDRDEYK